LPGVDIKIADADERGVGEIVASGPNVMVGYFENPEATGEVIEKGWLKTGDLGRIDDDGRLWVVGRKKEMILGRNGENVYPDELEDLYGEHALVKELSIVGLPEEGVGETVGALVVPDWEEARKEDPPPSRTAVHDRIAEHIKQVSAKLPAYKRVKVFHLTDVELPRTATRKVKRREVVAELEKLERLKKKAEGGAATDGDRTWIFEVLSTVSGKPLPEVRHGRRLEELGFDSLMYTELGVALEAAGVAVPENADLTGVATVDDFERLVLTWGRRKKKAAPVVKAAASNGDEIHVPKIVAELGSSALTWAQRMTYERVFRTKVTGRAHLPQASTFLVAANHASHLDMGLVKHALGDWGERLVALAAKDYFFEDPIKRAYFENFTNLVPMDRHGSLRESLRLASEVVKQGNILLIFPEGTRSLTGEMVDFKPSLGYLALSNKIDVVPMYLEGTFDALPKGSLVPAKRDIAAHIGPTLTWQQLREVTAKLGRADAYREASRFVERAVRALAPAGHPDRAGLGTTQGVVSSASVVIQEATDLVGRAMVPDDGGQS
jgi:long-chain acyl-CoA synthetase